MAILDRFKARRFPGAGLLARLAAGNDQLREALVPSTERLVDLAMRDPADPVLPGPASDTDLARLRRIAALAEELVAAEVAAEVEFERVSKGDQASKPWRAWDTGPTLQKRAVMGRLREAVWPVGREV